MGIGSMGGALSNKSGRSALTFGQEVRVDCVVSCQAWWGNTPFGLSEYLEVLSASVPKRTLSNLMYRERERRMTGSCANCHAYRTCLQGSEKEIEVDRHCLSSSNCSSLHVLRYACGHACGLGRVSLQPVQAP